MASEVKIGPIEIERENGGLRFSRTDRGGMNLASPVLHFFLLESHAAPVRFGIERLLLARDGLGASFHGYTTERVALDGQMSWNENTGGFDFHVCLENATEEMEFRLVARLALPGEGDPRWMIPGFLYGNNRPKGNTRFYPSFSDIGRDPRRMMYDRWAIRSDRAATPMVCAWTYRAFAWLYSESLFGRTEDAPEGIGMTGLYFGSENGTPEIALEYPYREEPVKFSFCHEDRTEPEETFVFLPEKTPLELEFKLGFDLPDLYGFAAPQRAIYQSAPPSQKAKGTLSSDVVEHSAHIGLLRWHFDTRQQAIFETATFDRHFGRKGNYLERSHMHAGWLSGLLPAYTLLWAGRETSHMDSVLAGTTILDKFAGRLAPCGTLFPVWTEEHGWSCSFGPYDGSAHSRTVGEACVFLLRALALEMRYGADHSQWVEALLSSLKYAMGAQREDGAFPAYYDLTTGRPTSYDGCAGLAWVAALAIGGVLLQRGHFKEVAIRGGEYYESYLRNAFLYGSVEDQPITPTSDDCQWALVAYLTLYEMNRDPRWLAMARRAADLALTWRFTYNSDFEPSSMLGRYGFRTCGGDISSVAAPVLGCNGLLIYRELVKLAAYTGDHYYQQRAEDSRLFASQLLLTEDGHFNGRQGMAIGQVFHTDWWQPKGIVLSLSYAMSAALLKHCELIRRHLAVSRQTAALAKEGPIPQGELEPILYTPDVGETPPPLRAAATVASDSMGDESHGASASPSQVEMGADSIVGSISRILNMRESQAGEEGEGEAQKQFPQLPPRSRDMRGLSSENVPIPGEAPGEPVPFPSFENEQPDQPPSGNQEEENHGRSSSGEIEIKYKIF